MDFSFSPEQEELRRAVRDLVADHPGSARAAIASERGYDDELWRLVARDLGLAGLAVPEDVGGAGGTFLDLAVALEETGRGLLPVPLLTSAVAAATLASCAFGGDELSAVAAGSVVATVARGRVTAAGTGLTGTLSHVVDGGIADLLLVAADDGLWLVRTAADGVAVEPRPTLDPTRRQASVRLDGAGATQVGDASAAAHALDLLRVGLAVELVGVMRWCLATTVDYLKTRVQFDRPIGSFQALQHRAADLVVAVEAATSTAYYAAWSAAAAAEELPVVAPLALSVCGTSAYDVGAETIQLHGGIGFTWEHDAHLYYRRAKSSELLFGDAVEHRERLAAALLD